MDKLYNKCANQGCIQVFFLLHYSLFYSIILNQEYVALLM